MPLRLVDNILLRQVLLMSLMLRHTMLPICRYCFRYGFAMARYVIVTRAWLCALMRARCDGERYDVTDHEQD